MVETSKSGSMSGEREWMPAHLAHRSCTSLRLYHLTKLSKATAGTRTTAASKSTKKKAAKPEEQEDGE